MILKNFFCFALAFTGFGLYGQNTGSRAGTVVGNLVDEKKESVAGASVQLVLLRDSSVRLGTISEKDGSFSFSNVEFGYHRLVVSAIGLRLLVIDSIHIRAERTDFSLNDLMLRKTDDQMKEVVVYAEKPLIQSKEGNIIYNASESPLSAGSNASDLLKNVPLVANDPNGKLTVRGKEPKILIDDKPVELNAQQLQDFLESMPGSMIERIEVMTNPPPQYANEPGGVINIVTRKGKVGKTGRINLYTGTRGENGINGNLSIRKKGLSINISAGMGHNVFQGNGYSKRENIYADSTNFFNTESSYKNKNNRPNARLAVDYDLNEHNNINFVGQYNQNDFDNRSNSQYTNLDRFKNVGRLSKRFVQSDGASVNPNLSLTYTHRGKKPGETFRLFLNANYSDNNNDRFFNQQFLNPDLSPTGIDSFQQQFTTSNNQGYSARYSYDKLFSNNKTSISTGAFYSYSTSDVQLVSEYLRKSDSVYLINELLSNDFRFKQEVSNLRFSFRHIIIKGSSVSMGSSAEQTKVHFDLFKTKAQSSNDYWTFLPFFNFNKQWEEKLNLTLSYRRTIRRPGMGELNPTIDYGDPYNLRFGNIALEPSTSHNFDFVLGRSRDKYYLNIGLGYNIVQNVFTQIRSLQPDGKTFVTWENIDDRLEYEVSTWTGYNFSKKLKVNFSASYSNNRYSLGDRTKFLYRNGGSFSSNLNGQYSPKDVWNLSSNFTFNRFANPQGYVRWNTSMNLGVQRKFLQKRLVLTLNIIDPIRQQVNRTYTSGPNFNHESYNFTQTRNYRLTITWNFIPLPKKKDIEEKEKLKKAVMQKN